MRPERTSKDGESNMALPSEQVNTPLLLTFSDEVNERRLVHKLLTPLLGESSRNKETIVHSCAYSYNGVYHSCVELRDGKVYMCGCCVSLFFALL